MEAQTKTCALGKKQKTANQLAVFFIHRLRINSPPVGEFAQQEGGIPVCSLFRTDGMIQ